MSLRLVIVDTPREIEDKVINAFRLELNSVFKRAAGGIQRRIGEVCDSLIKRTEEYQSLLTGELLGELGVPDVDSRLDAVLKTIKSSCEVEATPLIKAGNRLSGGIVVKMIKSDFMDLLDLPDAEYLTEKGVSIPWLDWILKQGDRIIVIGYDVDLMLTEREKARSRTGLALMKPGSGWRIDPTFSGTLDNNFITRAFDGVEIERLLLKIMSEEILSRL